MAAVSTGVVNCGACEKEGGRKIISQRSRKTDELDLFLAERNMCRKRIPPDESSLYRAVADQLWGDQTQFLRVKTALHNHDFTGNTQIPIDDNFTASGFVDHILGLLIGITSSVYKKDVCLFLQRGLSTLYHAYTRKDSSNVSEKYVPDKQVLTLALNHYLHFDSVYTFEEMAALATCQAIVYDVLYSAIFDLHGVAETVTLMLDRNQKFTIQCMSGGRSRDTLERITQGDYSFYDKEQNLVVLTDLGITPFPYKVAKCLSPFMYRNVSFDIWDSQRGLRRNIKGIYLRIGSKCVVHLRENIKCMGYVQELNNSKDTVTVYIEELGQQCELPQCIVEVVTTATNRPLGQFSRVAKMDSRKKIQQAIAPYSLINATRLELSGEEATSKDKNSGVFEASIDEASPNKMSSSPSSPKHSDSDNPDIIFHFSTSSEDGEEDHVASEIRCVEEGTFSVPYKNMLTEGAAPANLTYEYERGASSFLYMQDYSLPSCPSHITEQGLGVSLLNPDTEQGAAGLPQTQSSQASEEQFSTSSSYSGNQQFATGGGDVGQLGVGGTPRPDFSNFIPNEPNNQPNFTGYHSKGLNNEGPLQPNLEQATSGLNSPHYLPIDENTYFSYVEDGSDLPLHSINTLRYFYNHGIQFSMACKLQEYTKKPVYTTPPELSVFNCNVSQSRVVGPIGVVIDNGIIFVKDYPPNLFSPMVGHLIPTTNLSWANAEAENATAARAASATVPTANAPVDENTFNPLVVASQVTHHQPEGSVTAELFTRTTLVNVPTQASLPQTPGEYSSLPPFGNSTIAPFPGASVLTAGHQTQVSLPPGEYSSLPPVANATTTLFTGASSVLNAGHQTQVSLPPAEFLIPRPEGRRAAELFTGAPLVNSFYNSRFRSQVNTLPIPGEYSVPPPLMPHTPAPSDIQYQCPTFQPLRQHPAAYNASTVTPAPPSDYGTAAPVVPNTESRPNY